MGTTLEDVTTDHLWPQFDAASALAQEGRWREAIPQFETLLAADVPRDLRARSRWEDGIAAFERSGALFEQLGDSHNLSITLNRLGELHYERHDFPNAIQVYQRDLKIVEQLQDERAVAQALNNLALACV